jgi:hypothetical protein
MQFASSVSQGGIKRTVEKGNFQDAWAYLGMDEHLGEEAKLMRDKCRQFAERYNPEVSYSLAFV